MRAIAQKPGARSATGAQVWLAGGGIWETLAVALLALVCAGLCAVARLNVPAYILDLTASEVPQPPNLVGFHGMESNADYAYRWSSGYAFVQLLSGYNAAPRYLASVRARAANPAGPQPVTFLANERALATFTPPSAAFRRYELLLPASADGDPMLRFAVQTTPFQAPGDRRSLGLLMTGIVLRPAPFVDWRVVVMVPAALAGLWVLLRWRGAGPAGAAIVCVPLAAALVALYVLYRPAPLPYFTLALFTLAAAAAGALLLRPAAARMALALLAALLSFSGVIWPSWLSDDAFISYRYAQNLVAGHGLVYNVGERVEGYTNFLWTVIAALVLRLGGDIVAWSYLSGVGLALALLLLTCWLAARLFGGGTAAVAWALVAALFVATSQSVMVHTARGAGLETGLFALLALVGSAVYLTMVGGGAQRPVDQRPERMPVRLLRPYAAGLIFGLATLTRPEGAMLMALTTIDLLITGYRLQLTDGRRGNLQSAIYNLRSSLLPMLGAYLLIVLPFFLWRYSYYGDLLPNTFYAKTGGGLRQVLRGLDYAGGFALAMGGPLLLLILAPSLAGMRFWRRTARQAAEHARRTTHDARPSWYSYLLLLVGGYTAYVIAVGGDHFKGERFFVPLVPWVAILLANGLAWAYGWLRGRGLPAFVISATFVALLIVYSIGALWRTVPYDYIIQGQDESLWIWREIGWWMRDHSAPDETLAATGAGAVAFYSERTVIDLLGLTEKHIGRIQVPNMGEGPAGHEKRDPAYVLAVRKPTYIPQMWDHYFGGEMALRGQYELITATTRYGRELGLWRRLP